MPASQRPGPADRAWPAELREAGLRAAESARHLVAALDRPRLVLLSLPAGPVVDKALEDLRPHLDTGDVILDAGNSYWGDGIRRSEVLADDGIRFLNLGVSGWPDRARHAPCFMVGGPGAGHFVKLVHNGIEFRMLQAIGEGLAMLQAHPEPLDIAGALQACRRGAVIRSYVVDHSRGLCEESRP